MSKQAYFVEFALKSETLERFKKRGIVLKNMSRATITIVDEAKDPIELVGLSLQRNFANEFYRVQETVISAQDVAIMFYPVSDEMLAQLALVYQEKQNVQ